MTLVAKGPFHERIDLTALSDADWDELRRDAPELRCFGCGGRMHTRAIPLTDPLPDEPTELHIFAHNPHEGDRCRRLGWDESPGHHRLKRQLARGARRAGWTVELEVQAHPECRADVVATNPTGDKTHALEAQLAGLSTHDALERHKNYVNEFGRCTWTHTGRREWSTQVPSLRVDAQDQSIVVGGILIDAVEHIEAPPTPLLEVVPEVLDQRMLYVWDGEWGTYILREAMSRGGGQIPTRKRPRVISGAGAARFCSRMRDLGPEGRRLVEAGIAGLDEYHRLLREAHEVFRASGEAGMTERHWQMLAIAGEFPILTRPLPRLDLALSQMSYSAN